MNLKLTLSGQRVPKHELFNKDSARDLGPAVLANLYRLFKVAQVHDTSNQATRRQVDELMDSAAAYFLGTGQSFDAFFADRGAVFVGGQLLRGSRLVYESARDLGALLESFGCAELRLAKNVTRIELETLVNAYAAAFRTGNGRQFRSPVRTVELRPVGKAARVRGVDVETLEGEAKVVRTYALSIVVMRRVFEDLERGSTDFPRGLKRIAQNLVDLSERSHRSFLGVTEVRNGANDDAGKAVNGAILAVAMAREVTSDRGLLAELAMAALVFDFGRPRALRMAAGGQEPQVGVGAVLSEDGENSLGAATVAVLTSMSRLGQAALPRSVMAFEGQGLRRRYEAGPVYQGLREPVLLSRVIHLAREYCDRMTSPPGEEPKRPEEALRELAMQMPEPAERTLLRILAITLGVFPPGTLVRLAQGELAEVVRERKGLSETDRPWLRVRVDARGGIVDNTEAFQAPWEGPRAIQGIVGIEGWTWDPPETPGQAKESSWNVDVSLASSRRGAGPRNEASNTGAIAPSVAGETSSIQAAKVGEASAIKSTGGFRSTNMASPTGDEASAGEEGATRVLGGNRSLAESAVSGASKTPTPVPPTQVMKMPFVARGEPQARGSLEKTPLVQLLVTALDRHLSGVLVLHDSQDHEHALEFEGGTPVRVWTSQPTTLLGQHLVALGAVPSYLLDSLVRTAKENLTFLGEELVRIGQVDKALLQKALRAQVSERLGLLVNLPGGTTFEFYRGQAFLQDNTKRDRLEPDALGAIYASVLALKSRGIVQSLLTKAAKLTLRLRPDADLGVFPPGEVEGKVLEEIKLGRCTLHEIVNKGEGWTDVVESVVFTLLVTRQLQAPGQQGKPMAPKFVGVDDVSGLGNLTSATGAHDISAIKLGTRANAAGTLPSNDGKHKADDARDEYLRSVRACQLSDWKGALEAADKAVRLAPERTDYGAHRVYVRAMMGGSSVEDAIAALTDVLAKDAYCDEALLCRARLYARSARLPKAIADLEAFLVANPTRKDVAEELEHCRRFVPSA